MRQFVTSQSRSGSRRVVSSVVLCALLAACGGGGGDDEEGGGSAELPPPQVDSISPDTGDVAGGLLVTVTGSGFVQGVETGTLVTFDGEEADYVMVVDDNTITCFTPALTDPESAPVIVEVVVINSRGASEACECFEYFDPADECPQDTEVEPSQGMGGDSVTITGSQFTETMGVMFGEILVTDILIVDDGAIVCVAPFGEEGTTVDVILITPLCAVVAGTFSYVDTSDDPIIDSVEPTVGLPAGGTEVTITGSQFTEEIDGETGVFFGAEAAGDVVVVDDTTITCTSPPGDDNTSVSVFVTNPRGAADFCCFDYLDPSDDPILDSIDPTEGAAVGGDLVTLTGSQFTEVVAGETSVLFGETPATDVVVVDDLSITCTSPAGEPGVTVGVSVSNPRGTTVSVDYHFIDPAADDPQIAGIDPSRGEPAGGTAVTITGAQFALEGAGETTVEFGEGQLATDVVVVDDATITCATPPGLDGEVVDVIVTNDLGSGVLADAFTYDDPVNDPILTSIDPTEGHTDGGTAVTLSGSQFTEVVAGETSVSFGAAAATNVVVVDDATITCDSPPGEHDAVVDVSVVNPRGIAVLPGAYHYIDPTADDPQITGIDPAQGEPVGGTPVTISGSQFTEEVVGETTVSFGGNPATDVLVVDDATITCLSPSGTDGETVDVTVINPRGAASFTGFAYVDTSDDPVVSVIDPAEGHPDGGTPVMITGSQFTEEVAGETSVLFGSSPATNVVVVDDTTITCDSPAGLDNTDVDVSVVNPRGTGTLCCFSYLDPSDDPVISALDPAEGDFSGGTSVTISGSQFTETNLGETSVDFGLNPATDVVVVDDSTITCTSPGGDAADSVDVIVHNPRGSSAPLGFTYTGGEPILVAIDPAQGDVNGGEEITLTGSRFAAANAGVTDVSFDGVLASAVSVLDDTTITCISPAGSGPGEVLVMVVNALGISDPVAFDYTEDTSSDDGDLDGDGLMDLVVGAPFDDTNGERNGAVHVFLASGALAFDGVVSSSGADITLSGVVEGGRFGATVATGDLDNDGNEDLIVGAPYADAGGMVYVFSGPLGPGTLSSDDADHVFSSEETAALDSRIPDRFGSSLTVTDLDADGVDDLIVGALGTDFDGSGTTVFSSGLRNPMGLEIASDGSLWVAQAGSGSSDFGDPVGTALDDAGVARIDLLGVAEDVVSGLPSMTDEGFAGGSSDLLFDSTGRLVVVQGGGVSSLSNSVLELDVSSWTSGSTAQGPGDVITQWDIGTFGASLGYEHNNAYGVAEGSDGHLYVVNAGANAIFKVERPSGVMSEFATFPELPQPNPVGPPVTDSVPTRILAHADGFYVVNLTGFPFNDGAASVFDVDYSGTVTEIATGLSRATDVAVDPTDGSLYVTQFDAFDLTASPPWLFGTGAVVRVTGAGVETVASVTTPTGVAIAGDGTMYVSSMVTGVVHRFSAAPPSWTPDVGAAYVFRGGSDLGAFVHASGADVRLTGEHVGDKFGCSSGVGDFNGDGQRDLFIGASGAGTAPPLEHLNGGAVFLWLGPLSEFGSSVDADASFKMSSSVSAMGTSVQIGDVNGDGFDDLITGAPYADSEVAEAAGLCVVFRGDLVVYDRSADSADTILHGMYFNGAFGTALVVEDFSGDGVDDILVTSPSDSHGATRNGRTFLFNGGEVLGDSWAAAADVILTGRFREFEHFGVSAGAVDLDGDGGLDICVSAFGNGPVGPGAGAVHLFLGGFGLVDTDADDDDLTLEGEQMHGRFGGALSSPE